MLLGLLCVLYGIGFLYGYFHEKDSLLKWLWLYIAFTGFVLAFFVNTNLISSTTITTVISPTVTNATTSYVYGPDSSTQYLTNTLLIVFICVGILIGFRLIFTIFKKRGG